MTATFWLAEGTSFRMLRQRDENRGILVLDDLTLYGKWEDFEALGRRLLNGAAQLRKVDKAIGGTVGDE